MAKRTQTKKAQPKGSNAKRRAAKPAARRPGTAAARGTARKSAARKPAAKKAARGRAALVRSARKMGARSAEQGVPADALRLLDQDHREVEALFAQFKDLEGAREKAALAAKICLLLRVHTQIEEEILYPAARAAMDEEDMVDEAEVEHASAKQLIAEIEAMKPRDRLFDAKVKVLGEYVHHHVEEERQELFPALRDADLDLIEIGGDLAARKVALLAELTGKA